MFININIDWLGVNNSRLKIDFQYWEACMSSIFKGNYLWDILLNQKIKLFLIVYDGSIRLCIPCLFNKLFKFLAGFTFRSFIT